jgi:hypothetical protein
MIADDPLSKNGEVPFLRITLGILGGMVGEL